MVGEMVFLHLARIFFQGIDSKSKVMVKDFIYHTDTKLVLYEVHI